MAALVQVLKVDRTDSEAVNLALEALSSITTVRKVCEKCVYIYIYNEC